MKRTMDMTTGNPIKILLQFSVPVLLGTLFQQLYNMTDTLIVGQFMGESALAAVGSTGSTVYLITGFAAGLTQGFSILISQAFGAKRHADLKKLFAHALSLTLILAVAISIPAVLLCKMILLGMNTPVEILPMSHSYLSVIFSGILCTMLYNVLASTMRAMGDSKTPLYFLIFSSFLNIGLDIFFIVVSGLGTAGIALATVISQGVSAFLCLLYLLRSYSYLRLNRGDFNLDFRLILCMLRTGIPMAMNQSITAAGIMIAQSGINSLGSTVMAAYATATKIENLVIQPMMAWGAGISTFCGQNYGGYKFDRIYYGIRRAAIAACGIGLLGIVFYFGIAKTIVGLFVSDPSPELLTYAEQYLFTTVWFLPVLACIFMFRNALVGLGKGFVSMLGGILELISRMLCIHLLLPVAGYWCIRLINPITWIVACSLFMTLYFHWEIQNKRTQDTAPSFAMRYRK